MATSSKLAAARPTPGASTTPAAYLRDKREVLPGRFLLTLSASDLAARTQAGQYAYVTDPAPLGMLLPAVAIAGFDRIAGTVELLTDGAANPCLEPLVSLAPGDPVALEGPLGRGFEIDSRSRYLLVVTDASGLARVRAIVSDAVAAGRQVTVLLGASSVSGVPPSTLLPDEAEYVVATADGSLGHQGSITDLVADYEAWADQCFAAGSSSLLATMTTLARGRDGRMGVARLGRRRARRGTPNASETRRKAWLQIALPHPAGCALGVCLGCVTRGAKGPLRICREGPAFAADELRTETNS
jgi:dihydroorotate dehydrogenase electron transfer subunit